MKIIFDHQIFMQQKYGGISRYFVSIASELKKLKQNASIIAPIHQNKYLYESKNSIEISGKYFEKFPPKTSPIIATINNYIINKTIRNQNNILIHETYYSPSAIGRNVKRVITVYDMIHELFAKEMAPDDPTARNKKNALKRADHIICISESTKNDLIDILNISKDKISVTHLGVESNNSFKVEKLNYHRPYLLYVGNRAGYKNFKSLLETYVNSNTLKSDFDIVAFGGGAFTNEENTILKKYGIQDKIIHIAGNDKLLQSLYQSAHAFIYPSLYEGFGLPPLEAMANSCPVITSNTSSMPEVVGNAGCYFNPSDINSIDKAINDVVYNSKLRDKLISNGMIRLKEFTWEKCAQETLQVYKHVINE